MPHSFSNCPLRSSSLLITHHSTQVIVTATDEVLDLLGYNMSEVIGNSIHSLSFKPLSRLTSFIPECTIKHSNGNSMIFQVCVHQDPLGGSSCLDYWLIRPLTEIVDNTTHPSLSILKLSPYGTIEQVQVSNLNQPVKELLGRPVMAFIYKDDVQPLCSTLSKICSIHNKKMEEEDPLFIRWSRLPCLITTTNNDLNNSLNYDWMSFTLTKNTISKPICIIRSLQVETTTTTEDTIIQDTPYSQLLSCVDEWLGDSKIYVKEFYHHIITHMLDMVTTILYYTQQNGYLKKSNYLLMHILHFTGLLDKPYLKSYMDQ